MKNEKCFRCLGTGVEILETRGAPRLWPFLEMQLSESVEFDAGVSIVAARSAIQYASKTAGYKFRSRISKEGKLVVHRVK